VLEIQADMAAAQQHARNAAELASQLMLQDGNGGGGGGMAGAAAPGRPAALPWPAWPFRSGGSRAAGDAGTTYAADRWWRGLEMDVSGEGCDRVSERAAVVAALLGPAFSNLLPEAHSLKDGKQCTTWAGML
jgi:hypothetical protein